MIWLEIQDALVNADYIQCVLKFFCEKKERHCLKLMLQNNLSLVDDFSSLTERNAAYEKIRSFLDR